MNPSKGNRLIGHIYLLDSGTDDSPVEPHQPLLTIIFLFYHAINPSYCDSIISYLVTSIKGKSKNEMKTFLKSDDERIWQVDR